MRHRNTQFTSHVIDMGTDQHAHTHLHPEPCIFYQSTANFFQPVHSVVPAPGNRCNFSFHHMPEHHDNALFYGMPHLNGVQPQHAAINLDLAVAAPSVHYSPYLGPPPFIRDSPVHINRGAHDHLSLFSTYRILGFPTESYNQSITYLDSVRGSFKRKNADGAPGNYQYHNASAGPSSSVALVTPIPAEPDITLMQRNYVTLPVQLPGNPWLVMHFGSNNGDASTFAWTRAPLPYMHASVNGACIEAGNASLRGQQVRGGNRSSSSFLPPPLPQGYPNPHRRPSPMQGLRGYNAGPTFLAPVPSMGFQLYPPQHREIIPESSARQHTLPHWTVLPEDELAMLEVPGYHDAGDSTDQHSDMRLDIDRMSYEELLSLGEQIGNVDTGLTEEFIRNNLKVRTFMSSGAWLNLEEAPGLDEQINFCVICQTDYEDEEHIATLDCGHEYHGGCIKKWLIMKNTCPICKSAALSQRMQDL